MRNEEFEVVRDLIAGRAPEAHGRTFSRPAIAPASFREIDGEILARQYVAHRKFMETEAMNQRIANAGDKHDVVLRGERRQTGARPAGAAADGRSSSLIATLARFLWRR
jgi:hypothetical protein